MSAHFPHPDPGHDRLDAARVDELTRLRMLLEIAGVTAPEEELPALLAAVAAGRSMMRMLEAMPGLELAEPASVFVSLPSRSRVGVGGA